MGNGPARPHGSGGLLMKYYVDVEGGSSFEIEVARVGETEFVVTCNGREIEADFLAVDSLGQYAARIGNRSFAPSIDEVDQQNLRITMGRESFIIFATDEREKAALEIADNVPKVETLLAPMPGIVVAVKVEIGDRVEAGQCVVVLEAMKMQNEICAKHGGIVNAVLTSQGQSVSGNDRLVLLSNETEDDE